MPGLPNPVLSGTASVVDGAVAATSWPRHPDAANAAAARIIAAAPVAMLQLDRALSPVAANDCYRLLLCARGRDEIVDYRELLDREDIPQHDELLSKLARGDLASFRIEVQLHIANERPNSDSSMPRVATVLVGGAPFLGTGGCVEGFVVTLTDVTALRRHAEAEDRRQQALDQALEEMLAGLVVFDADDRLVFCNRRYREFYGVPDELARPGTRFADMLLEEVRSGKLAMDGDAQASFVAARLDRRRAHVRAHGRAQGSADTDDDDFTIVEQRNAAGQWLQIRERVMPGGWIVGVHVDATAVKDKEEALEAHIAELREVRAELEQRTAELSRLATNLAAARDEALGAARTKANFLANMSHELRTPLNAVIGFADILASGAAGALTARQTEYLTDIRNSGNHLLGVINDILDLSKAEAGKIKLHSDTIELAQILESTARLMAPNAAEKSLVLETVIAPTLADVVATVDMRRFRQVVLNLLSNAVKFTPEGGRVRIALSDVVEGAPQPGGIGIIISDTGIGISADDLRKVFAPFEQADSSLTRRYEGTGLGLSLVKALVELHQGRVLLRSTPGQGTDVTVWLPPARIQRGHGLAD